MCLWLLFVVFKYIIIDWFSCFLVFQSKNNFCISQRTHPSTSKLPFWTVFDRNFYLKYLCIHLLGLQAEFICIYITWFVCNTLFIFRIICLNTWFVCNTLFIFRIICFFNGLIYFSALLFQSKFLYLPKKSPFFKRRKTWRWLLQIFHV